MEIERETETEAERQSYRHREREFVCIFYAQNQPSLSVTELSIFALKTDKARSRF